MNILPQNLESYDTTTHTKGYNHIGGNEKIGFWGYQMIIHQTGERDRVRLWVCYNLLENLNNMGVCSPALGEQKSSILSIWLFRVWINTLESYALLGCQKTGTQSFNYFQIFLITENVRIHKMTSDGRLLYNLFKCCSTDYRYLARFPAVTTSTTIIL